MYIERKAGELEGEARIGRVMYSKSGRSLYYGGKMYSMAQGFKSNFIEQETGEDYWISGPHRDGCDRLYDSSMPTQIDDDVREEYWTVIRKRPDLKDRTTTNGGKRRD